MATVDVKS